MKKNILVFPCGSEIALEVYRSLKYSTHFNLIGANSIRNSHGQFIFENYIDDVPFVNDENFIPAMQKIIVDNRIDFVYPTMDSVITKLKEHEKELGCKVVSSPVETTEICLSKLKTYNLLKDDIRIPKIFSAEQVIQFPVFCKPEIGYGSRGAKKINNSDELAQHLKAYPSSLILEYLEGDEYTVDCFTDKNGKLLFCGARKRNRVMNGISVNTFPVEDVNCEFRNISEKINQKLKFEGAWFVQLKRNGNGELVLLEIASRLGGSSSLFRAKGINFTQLSLFTAMDCDVSICENDFKIEMDRALDNKFKIDINFNEVFIDYDDTIIVEQKYYNPDAMKFLYECKNREIKISLLSSHEGDLGERLEFFKLTHLFDRVIHIEKSDLKSNYIDNKKSIFIDDSYAERQRVSKNVGIPVFGLDMIGDIL